MSQLACLVIGCGSIGSRHARLLGELGHALWCADLDMARAQALADALPSAAAVQLDPRIARVADAVFVCTWPDTHLSYARWSIEYAVPTFIEKPLALGLEGVEELVLLAQERKAKTMVACNYRFHPALDGASIGPRDDVVLNVHRSPASDHAGGVRLDSGSHALDLANHLGCRRWNADYAPDDQPEVRRVGQLELPPTDEMYRRQLQHFLTEQAPMNPLAEAAQTLRTLLKTA